MRTGEAGRPGYVQVEVLGGINEHVQIPVWLREQQKTTHIIYLRTHDPRLLLLHPQPPETLGALQTSAN